MGQRSTIHHNVQLFISLNNQYAIIQWALLDAPTSIHGVFTTLCLSKYCLLQLCRKLCPNQISITIWKFTT